MNLQIAPAKQADSHDIVTVVKSSILSCEADHQNDEAAIEAWLANKTEANIQMWIAASMAYIAKQDDKIVGFILVSKYGEVLLNYVLPQVQGLRVGSRLMQTIKEAVQDNKLAKLTLESTLTAKDFYLRQGFEVIAPVEAAGRVVAFEMACPL